MQHFWPGLAVTGRSRQKHFNSFDIFITQKLDNSRLLASTDHLHYRNFNCSATTLSPLCSTNPRTFDQRLQYVTVIVFRSFNPRLVDAVTSCTPVYKGVITLYVNQVLSGPNFAICSFPTHYPARIHCSRPPHHACGPASQRKASPLAFTMRPSHLASRRIRNMVPIPHHFTQYEQPTSIDSSTTYRRALILPSLEHGNIIVGATQLPGLPTTGLRRKRPLPGERRNDGQTEHGTNG